MKASSRAFCLSLGVSTVDEAKAALTDLPAEISMVELRLDLFTPEEVTRGDWKALARDPAREWVFTWRSPSEGGLADRPPGILAEALSAGFSWIDVEAGRLEAGDPEAQAVPVARRWVSLHEMHSPKAQPGVVTGWNRVRAHPGALHKYVIPADRFEANTWMIDLTRRADNTMPRSIFASGWVGHASRIVGHLEGNAVTFVTSDEATGTAPGQPSVARVVTEYALPKLARVPRLYGVVGNPVHGSKSPTLHNHAFQVAGEDGLYIPLESPRVEPVLAWVREGRLSGLSVTAPFKERVFALVGKCEDEARGLGAVNTVWRENGEVMGGNTDVEAARVLLGELGARPGVRLAVLGAGGAATAVLGGARSLKATVTIFNRTRARARSLAQRFEVEYEPAEAFDPSRFDIVANCTPLGTAEPLPDFLLKGKKWKGTAILDLGYGPRRSAWEELSSSTGSSFRGGLDFLTSQAVGQFERWTGKRLPQEEFYRALGQTAAKQGSKT